MIQFHWCSEAETIGKQLISQYHERLADAKVAYLAKWDDSSSPPKKKPKRYGKGVVWAKASKVSPKMRALADYDFIIEVDAAVWCQLSQAQQVALVDHELCHCGCDADGYYMRDHDLEEFREVVVRHGLWRDSVRLFGGAMLPLFEKVPA